MSSLNKVQLIGNLGKDPETRRMTSGDPVVTLSIATSETWRDKASGERKEKTEWHRVVIFNKGLAEITEKYLRKGSKVYIEGSLQTRKWTDKSNIDRYQTEIVLSNFKGEIVMLGDGSGKRADAQDSRTTQSSSRADTGDSESQGGLDDEIPF